ncbi:MAG: fasciclin domain-containing protein [Pseudomonadota bacterium]
MSDAENVTVSNDENVVDIAVGNDNFDILVTALGAAGLVDTVSGLNDITVFAPTDAAFAALAVDLGYTGDPEDEDAVFGAIAAALSDLNGGDPIPLLTDILLYHVSGTETLADDLNGIVPTLLEDATFTASAGMLADNEPDLQDPTIVIPDIQGSNGVIQAIDRVLIPLDIPGNTPPPPNVVDIAVNNPDFEILVQALSTANLVDTVADLDDITVFAPTDAAFAALAADFGYTGDPEDEDAVFDAIVAALTDLSGGDPVPLLTDILLYHVSEGAKTGQEVLASDSINTLLNGATIAPDSPLLVDGEPDLEDPEIAIADIEGSNGIIQAIDRVLIPLDIPGNTTIADLVAASGGEFDGTANDFDILLTSLNIAGLTAALDDPAASLTVFAPDDLAFVDIAQTLGFDGDPNNDTFEADAFSFIVDALTLLSGGGDPVPLLTDILSYHVAPGEFIADDVLSADSIPTLLGPTLGVSANSIVDADPELRNPVLIETDITLANGVVHVIDGVLLPVDLLVSDGSNDVDFIIGDDTAETFIVGDDNDLVSGLGGDDSFEGGAGNDLFLGGDGSDTADVSGSVTSYTLAFNDNEVTVTDRADGGTGTDTLVDVETLTFGDGFDFVAEDGIDLTVLTAATGLGEAELVEIAELYVAYFDRTPDALGLYFWGTELADGFGIGQIASSFFVQEESLMKLPAQGEHGELVDIAYENLFDREADTAGKEYWVGELDDGNVTRAEFMLALIKGAQADTGSAADAQVISDKVDLGLLYAVVEGLGDVEDATAVNDAYDRDDRDASLVAAQDLIAGFADATQNSDDGLIVEIAGLIDDPFAMA